MVRDGVVRRTVLLDAVWTLWRRRDGGRVDAVRSSWLRGEIRVLRMVAPVSETVSESVLFAERTDYRRALAYFCW